MKYNKFKRKRKRWTPYLSDEYRAAVIKLGREVSEAFAKVHDEVSKLDLPSDYNDPMQMMIYDEIEYLLTALDSTSAKGLLDKKVEGQTHD